MDRADLGDDPELQQLAGRIDRIDEITAIVNNWVGQHSRGEMSAICEKFRIPGAPLKDVVEVLNDPHLIQRGFLTMQPADTGLVALPNSPMRYAGSDMRPLSPAPELGADTDAVLADLCGYDADTLATLRADGVFG
jgi:crotonobetainyl-CoA:carnitine CoA-transferase CaiB-like acyl-CoA transferase